MIEAAVTDKVARIVEDLLDERFGDVDGLTIEQVKVIPKIDHDGDEYLHIYIVFDGDQKLLDPGWTLTISRRIAPQLMELGVENPPSRSFVEKSEWEEVLADKSEWGEVYADKYGRIA